jgi:hypothetical protein
MAGAVHADRAEVEVTADLYPCNGWGGFTVVKFGARQLASAAPHALAGIRRNDAGRVVQDNQRRLFTASCIGSRYSDNYAAGNENKFSPRKTKAAVY